MSRWRKPQATAEHRPAVSRRRYKHDALYALDLFSGFGGLTAGIKAAGFTVIMAANHNRYKVQVHEANHPEAEHWVADLVNEDAADYHSVRDLPAADLLVAGVSCVNHSSSNTKRAYRLGLSLFDMVDPEYEERVTRSERDRATANCVLHYAATHRPAAIIVECTTQLQSWGNLRPGSAKVGDGSTYRWWTTQFENLGYRWEVVYLNSMFFGVGQSRDRGYWIFLDKSIPFPDLEHRPMTWCPRCDQVIEAHQAWKTGIPASGVVQYGKQYCYRCPRCHDEVIPAFTPSLDALDLSDLGTRIGDRDKPLKPATMARAQRCKDRFAQFPAVYRPGQPDQTLLGGALMPAKAQRGTLKHLGQPLATQTSQQETALLLAVDNCQGAPRGVDEPLATQGGSETMALLSAGVLPFRKNTTPASHLEAMPTITSEQIPGLLTAAGTIKNNDAISEAKYRAHPLSDPLGTITADPAQAVLFSGWFKQNGSTGTETASHPVTDPLGTLTSRDTTGLLTARWHEALQELSLEDCYFRMMHHREIGRGCGFDVDWNGRKGTFKVWGSARDRVDGYGNAVSPPVGRWLGEKLFHALHSRDDAA